MTKFVTFWFVADNGATGDIVLNEQQSLDRFEVLSAVRSWGESVGAESVTFYLDDGSPQPLQCVLDVNTFAARPAVPRDWYWKDSVPYCPLCVEGSSPPAVDWDDCSRGPCVNGKCGCCGGKSNADVPAV